MVAQRANKPMSSYKTIRQTNSPARISQDLCYVHPLLFINVYYAILLRDALFILFAYPRSLIERTGECGKWR